MVTCAGGLQEVKKLHDREREDARKREQESDDVVFFDRI